MSAESATPEKKLSNFLKVPEENIETVGPFMHVRGALPELQKKHLHHLIKLHGESYMLRLLDCLHSVVNLHTLSSLRMIDWLVTNYSRANTVIHNAIDIHSLYVRWRHNYNRVLFDPFRRRVPVYYLADSKCECGGKCGGMLSKKSSLPFAVTIAHKSVVCTTTVAQINFFVFALEADLLGYISVHASAVEEHQTKCLRAAKEKRERMKDKFKRSKLSKPAAPTCVAVHFSKIF